MQYFIGSEDGLPDFLLEYPLDEVALPANVVLDEEQALALDRTLEVRDLGRPVVSMYPGGTTVVSNPKDVRQVLVPPPQPDPDPVPEGEAQPPTESV